MASGVLAILGSGEIAPSMTKVHRELLARLDPARAVSVDTAYAFQENVPQMSEKLESYFAVSLQTELTTLHFAHYEQSTDIERALIKQHVREANYVFAGPGSPSYALAQWTPLGFGSDLLDVLDADGTLCISSAAALTLGAFTAPVYEIYKVGAEPYWLAGLNIVAALGLSCVVIPHFDNNEGENYDTRFCYLGERRLTRLEGELPEGVATLGIDEHTALIIDRKSDTVTVKGRSNGYWRLNGEIRVLANDTTTPLDNLRQNTVPVTPAPRNAPTTVTNEPLALAEIVGRGGAEATEALARLVTLAVAGGEGHIDPTSLVDGVLTARRDAREQGQYQLADQLRDSLVRAGIDVHDGPEGSTWSLRD